MDELSAAGTIAVALLGVRHQHFLCKPTGCRYDGHKSTARCLCTDVAFLREDSLAVFLIFERAGVGMET